MDKWRSDVSRAHVELGKLRSDLEASRNANLAPQRDIKEAQERCEMAQATAVERDSAVAKLHVQIAEFRCRCDEHGEKLKDSTSAFHAIAEEVKKVQDAMNEPKDK